MKWIAFRFCIRSSAHCSHWIRARLMEQQIQTTTEKNVKGILMECTYNISFKNEKIPFCWNDVNASLLGWQSHTVCKPRCVGGESEKLVKLCQHKMNCTVCAFIVISLRLPSLLKCFMSWDFTFLTTHIFRMKMQYSMRSSCCWSLHCHAFRFLWISYFIWEFFFNYLSNTKQTKCETFEMINDSLLKYVGRRQ